MLPTISLGPLVIPTGGLVYILGAWLALSAVERAAKRLSLDVPSTYGVGVVVLVAGMVGARLIFVLTQWSAYAANPVSIIWPLTSGFNAIGGLIMGLIAGAYYGRWKKLPLARTLDALTPGILVVLMTVSLADFLAGPGYGKETLMVWGIDLFGIKRHPVQIYELLVAFVALLTWWEVVRKTTIPGKPFLFTVAVYSAGRLLVDAFRAGSPLTADGYHVVQLTSLTILVVCLLLLARDGGRSEKERQEEMEPVTNLQDSEQAKQSSGAG